MTRLIFAFIAANVVVFLVLAFVAWEIDPSAWTAGGRAIFAILGCLSGLTAAAAAGEMK